jgi:hypothetical protein
MPAIPVPVLRASVVFVALGCDETLLTGRRLAPVH